MSATENTVETPKNYLSGPDSRGLWSLIQQGMPLNRPSTVEECETVARGFKIALPLPRFTDGRFVQAEEPAVLPVTTVRARQTFGGCRILGTLVAEKEAHFSYKDASTGRTKIARKDARAPYANGARPAPHVVPCRACPDHADPIFVPGACMHGKGPGVFCESCASM